MSETYKKVDFILLPYSASAVINNLQVKSKYKRIEDVAVIHHDTVCVVPTKTYSSKKFKCIRCFKFSNENCIQVTQVAWCHLGYETVIVVTSTAGLQVFNQQGDECIFSHPCSDVSEKNHRNYARGIAQFNSFYFCIGNSAGCIRMFGPPDLENEISFIDRKQNHKFAISDLSACKNYLASVDVEGHITLWLLETEELIHKITIASRSNCTGILLKKNWLVTVYGSGLIRLYSLTKGTSVSAVLTIEIAAHARTITGCDVSENSEYLLTTSEDSYAKIWHLIKDGDSQTIKHAHDIAVKDNMLMGGKFLSSNGNKFCVTSYDSNVISCFSI